MNPDTFEELLQHRLGDPFGITYRVRWCPRREVYAIEQKVGRGFFFVPEGMDPHADETIRLRDGYHLVMEVAPAARVKCEMCGFYLEAPALRWAELRCDYCASRGEKSFYYVAYFPLCDALLTQLEKTSPKRMTQWAAEMDAENQARARRARRHWHNELEALTREHAAGVIGIKSSTDVAPSPRAYRLEGV